MASLKRKLNDNANKDGGKGNKGGGKNKRQERGFGREGGAEPPIVIEMRNKGYLTKCKGDNICFNYNLGTCTLASPGQKCPKGWHVCAHQACKDKKSPHSAATH